MPPKRSKKETNVNPGTNQEQDDIMNNHAQSEDGKMASFEDVLDRRLKQQTEFLTDLFTKFFKMLCLNFLSSKYDEFAKSANEMRESLDSLLTENKRLCERVSMLESMVVACDSEMENVKQYIRRDMLELLCVPVTRDENTNEIVKGVVNLLRTTVINFTNKTFPSGSHRLPAPERKIPPIIAKFTRRNTRDHILSLKRQLQGKSTLDFGFSDRESYLFKRESYPENK